jgi:predicted TIM-barrel fold metal-dependent hydrolase
MPDITNLMPNGDQIEDDILEPNRPIIDSHHHLWFTPASAIAAIEQQNTIAARALAPMYRANNRYLLDEFLRDVTTGHNVRATVYVESGSMYRMSGPAEYRSVGEVEFANGIAATSASGNFGKCLVAAGIIGGVDFSVGAQVENLLEAQMAAAAARFKGVRSPISYDEDLSILGSGILRPHILRDEKFRSGFACLQRLGLSFDAWLFEPQLGELIELARDFPDTTIIVNHIGGPLLVGRYEGTREQRFPLWRDKISSLATCSNVFLKLGGLGTPFFGFASSLAEPRFSSEQLAVEWRPYIETCIEAFGAKRCMFESNYPVDWIAAPYAAIWNAFKRITSNASETEKNALFFDTANEVYRLGIAREEIAQ